jgi:hypothetical protein
VSAESHHASSLWKQTNPAAHILKKNRLSKKKNVLKKDPHPTDTLCSPWVFIIASARQRAERHALTFL